jgi:hypothetical protein
MPGLERAALGRVARFRRFTRAIRRDAAEQYLLLTLLSFAASVTITRTYLSSANYPQIGTGEVHIAHVLWGGLLLYIASLLPLLFANRRVYTLGALLTGTGIGLFIDEVGKFITKKNDYFVPVAASIMYVLFLLTIWLYLRVRRDAARHSRDALTRIFEDIWEALQHPLAPAHQLRLKQRLETAASTAPSRKHAELARALLNILEGELDTPPAPRRRPGKSIHPLRRIGIRLLSHNSLRVCLVIGLLGLGLLALKDPATFLLGPWLPSDILKFLAGLHVGRHIDASTAPLLSSIRAALEVIAGLLFLAASTLLALKRDRPGTALAYLALLLSLTAVNILVFYFEQFSTIMTTAVQFLLLSGVIIFRRHMA